MANVTTFQKSAEETGFIAQRRIQFSYVLRNGKNYLNGVYLLLPEEPIENWVYIKREVDGFSILREPEENSIPREVTRCGRNCQTKINFRYIAEAEKMYNIFQTEKGYSLKETDNNKPKRVSINRNEQNGLIIDSCNSSFTVPKKYIKAILRDKMEPMSAVITEYYKPYQYMTVELKPTAEIAENEKENKFISLPALQRKTDEEKITRTVRLTTNNQLKIRPSRFYMQAAGLKTGDKLYFGNIEANKITIINSEKICSICGKPIKTYKEKVFSMNACSPCSVSAKILKSHLEKDESLDSVKQNLLLCQKLLNQLVEKETA